MASMNKGFMKLNDDELNWLDGKIGAIDIQHGCPHQCIVCGADAEKYNGSMLWKDFTEIADSILEAKIKKNINLWSHELHENSAILFWSSDPVYYMSKDGNKQRTFYDVVLKIHKEHNKNTAITTAGWRPGNNYVQNAVEKIVVEQTSKNSASQLNSYWSYSIKATSPRVMNEYDKFRSRDTKEKNIDRSFIFHSKYTSQILSNLKTLTPIYTSNNNNISYWLQYVKGSDLGSRNFLPEYKKYSSLFSEGFARNLACYIVSCGIWKENSLNTFHPFAGIGKGLNNGLEKSRPLIQNQIALHKHISEEHIADYYHAMVDSTGRIQIYYGHVHSLDKIKVPKEHFEIISHYGKNKHYEMLANLIGKKLLE